jgi:hypothetical protein
MSQPIKNFTFDFRNYVRLPIYIYISEFLIISKFPFISFLI